MTGHISDSAEGRRTAHLHRTTAGEGAQTTGVARTRGVIRLRRHELLFPLGADTTLRPRGWRRQRSTTWRKEYFFLLFKDECVGGEAKLSSRALRGGEPGFENNRFFHEMKFHILGIGDSTK
jgi:hypothetical protein